MYILGSGSVGLLWAASIRHAFPTYPITALLRSHYRTKLQGATSVPVFINEKWNRVTQQNRKTALVPVQYLDQDPSTSDEASSISTLMIATKGQHTSDALRSVLPRLTENPTIIVLCNGALHVRDIILGVLQGRDAELVLCCSAHGVHHSFHPTAEPHFKLDHIGSGHVYMGGRSDVAQLWSDSGLNAKSVENVIPLLWQKLAANCLCNPLTTLWQATNGECAQRPEYPQLRESLLREVSMVAQALYPDMSSSLTYESLDHFVETVVQRNFHNTTSMYQDVRVRQQMDTEIDCLNGFVMRKGKELQIPTPVNEDLTNQILHLTQRMT